MRVRWGVVAGMAVAVVLAGRDARPAGDAPGDLVEYANDTLSVRLTNAPISDVIQEICRQSGAEMRGQVLQPREVTAEFQSVPLADALGRLLGEQAFALVYGKGGRLKAVRLLGGPQPQVVAVAPGAPTATTGKTPFPGTLPELLDRYPPVPVDGQLAEAVGGQSATLRQLLGVTLHHDDPAVRSEALRKGIATLEGDAALRSAVIAELKDADSAQLTALLRSSSEQAEDLAAQVLQESRAPEIRLKASAVLQRLRTGG